MALDGSTMFTATMLETAISNSSDLWGLFQPFSHLNAGRTATGQRMLGSASSTIKTCIKGVHVCPKQEVR
ncbi:hypothetical protein CEXT_653571 [Caerostris extrusa]|uniref:Uncharacterized protein n=1 Tax=Caerostris extrusa TaxID=172846 RepID=A0AAV4N7Y5_CAEEX|nr:hypothetical protein CEXT_653571 [Caerostris extrusa]